MWYRSDASVIYPNEIPENKGRFLGQSFDKTQGVKDTAQLTGNAYIRV